jgi:hypothetical protein
LLIKINRGEIGDGSFGFVMAAQGYGGICQIFRRDPIVLFHSPHAAPEQALHGFLLLS